MANKISLPNVTAIPKGQNDWIVVFNKRIKGKQIKKQKLFKGSPTEAERFATTFRDNQIKDFEITNTSLFDIKKSTITNLLDYFLLTTRKGSEDAHKNLRTYKNYKSAVNKLKESCGHVKIYPGDSKPFFRKFHEDFRPIFKLWFTEDVKPHMVNGKISNPYKKLSETTIYKRINFLRGVFKLLVDDDMIDKNPMDNSFYLRVKPNRSRNCSFGVKDDPIPLLNFISQNRPHILPIVLFSFHIPSRKNELTRLPKKYLNLNERTISIPANFSKNGEEIIKTIPNIMFEYFNTIPLECDYIFYRKVGGNKRNPEIKYFPIGDFKKTFNWCKKKTGYDKNVFHDTRHYAATKLEENGNSIRDIMNQAGWRTNMMDTYRNRKEGKTTGDLKFSKEMTSLKLSIPFQRETQAGDFLELSQKNTGKVA